MEQINTIDFWIEGIFKVITRTILKVVIASVKCSKKIITPYLRKIWRMVGELTLSAYLFFSERSSKWSYGGNRLFSGGNLHWLPHTLIYKAHKSGLEARKRKTMSHCMTKACSDPRTMGLTGSTKSNKLSGELS